MTTTKQLRSTDLMVGDYVLVKTTHLNKDNTVVGEQYVYRTDVDLISTLRSQELGFKMRDSIGFVYAEPIEITEKILEDSGLENNMSTFLYDTCGEYEIVITAFGGAIDGKWHVNMNTTSPFSNEKTLTMQTVAVKYVHELQHVLKIYTGDDTRIKIEL